MGKRGLQDASQSGSNKKAKAHDEKSDALPVHIASPMPMDVTLGKEQTAHLVRVHESLNIIKSCPLFEKVAERPPLTIMQGGNPVSYTHLTLPTILRV